MYTLVLFSGDCADSVNTVVLPLPVNWLNLNSVLAVTGAIVAAVISIAELFGGAEENVRTLSTMA